ncbi:uncharacterized protein TM35_000044200 [Trypanosoma theileri]|uniref:Uncharacterized protein n=1 Tax=Trypanosoma theileri TaxID=67003 RepID=A0A1X0P5I6_9TRYP|nr:uncharacterized protein TM35_000044200 [Trypanosoma theileri]ORC92206.1 hypothetical protein TM35_000044200 [Trypanosoma theileri]
MTKDRINFRHSMKNAHGSLEMENAVGVTELRTANLSRCSMDEVRNARVTGLMKWSFDDFIVKEVWPDVIFSKMESKEKSNTTGGISRFLLPVISEGVPDGAIATLIEEKCPIGTSVQFVSPVDFGSCQERFVLVYTKSRNALSHFQQQEQQQQQKFNISDGVVYIGKAIDISTLQEPLSPLPIHLLPDLRYRIVLRGIKGALADLLPRLENLQSNGFLNYSHLARHGVGLFRTFESGRFLLHREYPSFISSYILGLTERSPLLRKEINPLLEIIANPKSTREDWKGVKKSLEYALKKDEPIVRRPQTGLYYPHHILLRDFLERAADIFPVHHDSAQVIRESIPRLIIQEKLRSVADVHFNAMASLRWELYGDKVVIGDLVIPKKDEERDLLDIFEAPADHVNGNMTSLRHPEWLSICGEKHLNNLIGRVRIIQSREEAEKFSIDDVVLPVLGFGAERLILPHHRMKEASERLSHEFQIEGLSEMKISPPATYRRLVVRPKDLSYCLFDDERGWSWESHPDIPIRPQLYKDQDGITRQISPFFLASGKKNMIARSGFRGIEERSHFLKPARRPGMTCIVEMTLPRGSAVSSALREVLQFATIDPGAIFHLLR